MTELIRLKMKPNKGDLCRVRILATGNVVDAIYECPSEAGMKMHLVKIGINPWFERVAGTKETLSFCEFRFVGPAGVIE